MKAHMTHINEWLHRTNGRYWDVYKKLAHDESDSKSSFLMSARKILANVLADPRNNMGDDDAVATSAAGFSALSYYVLNGPKTYFPDHGTALSLESIEPKVGLADYCQPFPAFCVQLPSSMTDLPLAVITFFDGGNTLVAVILDRDHGHYFLPLRSSLSLRDELDGLASDLAKQHVLGRQLTPLEAISASLSQEESLKAAWWAHSAIRALTIALNANMLLVDYGHKREQTDTIRKLRTKVAESQSDGIRDMNRRALRSVSEIVCFSQDISLASRCLPSSDGSGIERDEEGRLSTSPHWRRAHIRMQRCGKNLLDRRRVLIDRVFVNRDKFNGDFANTSVSYG